MKEITVSTNMHCQKCVTKLGNILNAEHNIHHWSADVTKPNKPVTIHGNITEEEVKAFIEKAGFKASPDETVACNMSEAPATFWSDKTVWRKASFNTLNCLIGCSIGDFATVVILQAFYPQTPMWLQMLLATIAGLITSVTLETNILHWKEKLTWKAAFTMAISMSFISMVAMEIVMNISDFMITGGKAQLTSPMYWFAFVPAAVAGFLAPLPYNYFRLKKYNQSCH